jgi:hypothetical protein
MLTGNGAGFTMGWEKKSNLNGLGHVVLWNGLTCSQWIWADVEAESKLWARALG